MADRIHKFVKHAENQQEAGNFESAGEYYGLAAFASYAESGYSLDKLGGSPIGRTMYYLLTSATCFRVAQANERSQLRCKQGILMLEELRDFSTERDPEIGILWETIGDLEIIGELNGYEDSYAKAALHYQNIGYDSNWAAEPPFDRSYRFFEKLLEIAEYELEDYLEPKFNHMERLNFKRTRFPEIVKDAVEERMPPR